MGFEVAFVVVSVSGLFLVVLFRALLVELCFVELCFSSIDFWV